MVMPFTELGTSFWGKESEFDHEHVSELSWRFSSEDVEYHIGYVGLEFRRKAGPGLEYEFVKHLD